MTIQKRITWKAIGKTIRGSSHKRLDKSNQDYIDWHPKNKKSSSILVMAISDGHGNEKCYRSNRGSQFAVTVAINCAKDLIKDLGNYPKGYNHKRIIEEQLPSSIVKGWKDKVLNDIIENPLVGDENQIPSLIKSEYDQLLIYGATLLLVIIWKNNVIYLQLGDGDILLVTEKGETIRPLQKDTRLIANETTSLCSLNAKLDFQFFFQKLEQSAPTMIIMSTDGYSNSFQDDDAFMKVGDDIYKLFATQGVGFVDNNLENWLQETSELGSGDDISVGIIYQDSVFTGNIGNENIEIINKTQLSE